MPIIASANSPRGLHILDRKQLDLWLKRAPNEQKTWIKQHNFTARKNTLITLPHNNGQIHSALIGTSQDPYNDGAIAARLPQGAYEISGATDNQINLEQIGLGFLLEQYRFDHFRKTPPSSTPSKTQLVIADKTLFKRINAIADAVILTRDLINMPANHLTPQELEDAARKLAKSHKAKIKTTKGKNLQKLCPAIHTVGRAAEIQPRLIDLIWDNRATKKDLAITLIGKGITFDSGGLDLKPSSAMEIMKKDMGGAAHVLGLAKAIMALKLKIRLRVLIPAAENAVSHKAMRPLDVIKTAAGIPVEVGNTDAEGRLVLADAFHLATAEKPDLMIDFATLTGAARVAVGAELPALFVNNDALAHDFIAAGQKTRDPLWLLPLHQPYERFLEAGHVALSSTGSSRYGGAITAALFLQRFLQKPTPWAHIDVMAWNLDTRPGHPRGGEAMGLRAALELIENKIRTAP